MSITTMGDKTQAFDIFQTPLSSHYPLPLRFNKVPVLASEAGKIEKATKRKKAAICLKQSSKRRHIFYSENDYSIEKSKFKIR
jgi:hypothetical protein